MGRILGIDYGKKRVGLAVTDMNRIIATKLATVSTSKIWEFLHTYFQNEKVDEVIIGYPLQMNNTASEAVAYINPFIKKFQVKYPEIPIIQVDERFTSKMAFRAMIDGGVKKWQEETEIWLTPLVQPLFCKVIWNKNETDYEVSYNSIWRSAVAEKSKGN